MSQFLFSVVSTQKYGKIDSYDVVFYFVNANVKNDCLDSDVRARIRRAYINHFYLT